MLPEKWLPYLQQFLVTYLYYYYYKFLYRIANSIYVMYTNSVLPLGPLTTMNMTKEAVQGQIRSHTLLYPWLHLCKNRRFSLMKLTNTQTHHVCVRKDLLSNQFNQSHFASSSHPVLQVLLFRSGPNIFFKYAWHNHLRFPMIRKVSLEKQPH